MNDKHMIQCPICHESSVPIGLVNTVIMTNNLKLLKLRLECIRTAAEALSYLNPDSGNHYHLSEWLEGRISKLKYTEEA